MTKEPAEIPKNRTVGTLTYTTGGLALLFFWLLFGDFAISMRERAALPSVTELLRQHHASATTLSVLLTVLPAIISMVLVPVVCYKSDRFRSRWGRRIPFLIIPTPVAALAMVGIGFCPWLGKSVHGLLGAASPGVDFCVLFFFCIFWTLFEILALLTLAILNGLLNDVVPHGLLGRFFACFRMVSLGAGMVFNYWIFKLTETHLFEIFLFIGLFFGAAFTLMCVMVKEGGYPPPESEEAAGGHPRGFVANARSYLKECFSHSYYLWIFAGLMVANLAFAAFGPFAQWYADSLGMPKDTFGKLTAMAYGVSICLAFLIGWLVDRLSALRVAIAMMSLYMLVSFAGFFLVRGPFVFGVVYVLAVVLSGSYFTAAASLPMVLFPKLRFTQFASAAGILQSVSTIALGMTLGPLLDLSGRNYAICFLISGIFATAGLAFLTVIVRKFRAREMDGQAAFVTP